MKKTLLIISDGNGVDSDNFKKWPFYLKLLTAKTLNIINRSVVGSSNELMLLQLAQTVKQEKINYAIIQWTTPNRVDVIATEFWKKEAAKDQAYYWSLAESNNKQWWVTSGSKNVHIRDYHDKYVGPWHAAQRTQSSMLAAKELLTFHKIEFVFSLCYDFSFIFPYDSIIESYPWAWHYKNQGLSSFRNISEYKDYDKGLPQPHQLIGYDWIDKVLKNSCSFIDYDDKSYYKIKKSLLKQCSK